MSEKTMEKPYTLSEPKVILCLVLSNQQSELKDIQFAVI